MCASVFSLLCIFTTTLTISTLCGTKMATEGLPFRRQERGADILAGADFLSIFIESSLRRAYSETTTSIPSMYLNTEDFAQDDLHNYIRSSRSTPPFVQSTTEEQSSSYPVTPISDKKIDNRDSSKKIKSGVVVAVRVSSSINRTVHKDLHPQIYDKETEESTFSDTLTEPPTTDFRNQHFVASEEHPSLVAKASKSELSVEEREPVTKERDLSSTNFNRDYPANVRALPFDPGSSFLSEELKKDPKSPFHQTIIYHDNPSEPGRARSISYSTVIQAVPHLHIDSEKPVPHERHERNYNNAHASFINKYELNDGKKKANDTKIYPQESSVSEGKTAHVTSTSESWENLEENYDVSTKKNVATTERNWETQEKPYSNPETFPSGLSQVYGQPEQNYEVDEAVSVVTNGRAHGLQVSLPSAAPKTDDKNTSVKKDDDNQKVGYVVEGRNYRKYRVEERTADGFIVGEYGVVSHDDGSLRGVRYTADGTINPRVISDALKKFLSL